MKAAKLLNKVERQAVRLLGAARKRYDGLMRSAAKASDKAAQKRYIKAAEQTVAGAEKIFGELNKRIASAKKSLSGGKKKTKKRTKRRKVKRSAKRRVKRKAKRSSRKKRG